MSDNVSPANPFPIGTTYTPTGKGARLCTVRDYHRTYNNAGDLVRFRYVVTRELLGQTITDSDVIHTTIARALYHGFPQK